MKTIQNITSRLASRVKGFPPALLLAAVVGVAMVLTGMERLKLEQSGAAVAEERATSLPANELAQERNAFPVFIVDDGTVRVWFTARRTAGDVLRELGISVTAEDAVIPSPDTEISEKAVVEVIRPRLVVVEREEPIPHETLRRHISSLPKGKETVMQEGRDGRLVKRVQLKVRGDEIIEEKVLEETVIEPAVAQVVAVGTRNAVTALSASSPDVETVTRDGVTFGVKKVLENVTLTAYHAGLESTGKTEDHPLYGVTYTGTRVKEGQTIAVDPDVIPLGWWVYIEGIGFRRAEDTGSAVKGRKIDIYMEDEEQAQQFGLKRGYTVYLIGPELPSP